ncbi:MAG: hypothetical protein E7481_03640 [Ruminococcaceae bacterium]|nr:hypothetical protein [Oscillospiraceae bacterium]
MKLKKLALLGIALLMLTSCAAQPVELIDFLDKNTGEIDYEGMTFTIADSGSAGGTCLLMPNEDIVPSVRSEMLFSRYDEIEETYNCEVEIIMYLGEILTIKKATGEAYADLMNLRLNTVYEQFDSGYLFPFNEIPKIDLSSGNYGSQQLIEALTWNGDTVAIFPQYWGIMTPNFCDAVYFNPEVFTMINIPTPHELYETDSWDWKALEQIGKACSSISTEDRPVYLSTLNNYFVRMMILSNGGEYISETADGRYEYGMLTDETITAIEKSHNFYTQGYLFKYPGSVAEALDLFVKNQIALIAEYSVQGISTDGGVIGSKMQGAYGWAFNPKGPNSLDQTTGLISNENQYIVATIDKAAEENALGSFIDILFHPLGEEPNDWVDTFLTMNFYDEESKEVFMTKFENTIFDHVVFAYQNDTIYEMLLKAAETGSVRENVEKLQSQVNAKLDEGINKGK